MRTTNIRMQENIDLPTIYYKIAEGDLQAAEILYNNSCYPQALYFLVQSIEKMIKTLTMIVGLEFYIENQNRKPRKKHNIVSIFLKKYRKEVNFLIDLLTPLKINDETGETLSEFLRDSVGKIENYKTARHIIDNIEIVFETLKKLEIVEKNLAKQPYKIEKLIKDYKSGKYKVPKRIAEPFKKYTNIRLKKLEVDIQMPLIYLPIPLIKILALGLIMEKFYVVTRYYVAEYRIGPLDFDKDNPLIKGWDFLFSMTKNTIEEFRKILTEIQKV